MLELSYSNRTEALLDLLAVRVAEERAGGSAGDGGRRGNGIWDPVHIVVPNPYLKEYVRMGLARRLGVAANLHFGYLAGLWKDLLADDTCRILDADLLRAGLLEVLGDGGLLAGPAFQPVRDYLGPADPGRKRVQLATELAKVFEEYQLGRPEWIEAWRAGGRGDATDAGMEAWQSALWRAGVEALDRAEPSRKHLTLLERIRRGGFQGIQGPRAIHAFGFSHVAQAYREVYQAFVPLEGTTLHIYALNPCAEFWDDLATVGGRGGLPGRREARRGAWDGNSEDFYELASQGPLALRLWSRPGRENIRLLNEVSDCDFTSAFQVPGGDTLLARIQRDILRFQEPGGEGGGADLAPPSPLSPSAAPSALSAVSAPSALSAVSAPSAPPAAGGDGSVLCMACPSPRREAECVASEIWRLLEVHGGTEEPLRLSDIAVMVPPGQQEATLAHLQAAFQDARRIPMVQSDRALPVMRQTLEAVRLLLDLPTSGLTRSALLEVLRHPALGRRFPGAEAWARWCETYGIVRGADREAWEGTYLDRDALSWDQGLRRLALGAFMDGGVDFEREGETYRVEGIADPASAATFIALARGLCGEAQELLRGRAGPRAWMGRIREYLERWLQADESDDAEAVLRSLERIRTFLERPFECMPGDLDPAPVDFAAARHLALEALERLRDEQPASLSKGVVVGTCAALRAIPFRAVFLMGLGEGSFPTRNRRSALDLRAGGRRPGDVTQTEKEKYLFLETLLSARDHLVLSYVALDELSGEAFEPSGLLKEFQSLLGDYLPGTDGPPLLETHPLRRFDPAYFPGWFGGAPSGLRACSALAQAEARARWLGEEARRTGVSMAPSLGDLDLEPGSLGSLRRALETPEVLGGAGEVLRIRLRDLRTFLECPLSGAAAVRLGLRVRDLEDRAAVEDEPFESPFLEGWSLRQEVAMEALRSGAPVEEALGLGLRRLQDRGGAPFGLFAELERERNLGPVSSWVEYLRNLEGPCVPLAWRLGPDQAGRGEVDHPHPPLSLAVTLGGRVRNVELVGDLRPQLEGSLFLEQGAPPSEGAMDRFRKKALGAYLDHLVLACLEEGHGGHGARFVFDMPKGKPPVRELVLPFRPLSREAAQGQLRAWIEDLLTGEHDVLMPIEAVLAHWREGDLTPEAIRAYVEEQLDSDEGFFSTRLGPVPDPWRFAPPAHPMILARERLGAALDAVFGISSEEPS